jgi:hypothetical protein
MPLIRCTRKLLTEIGAQVASSAELAQPALLGDWFANLIRIGRRKCVIFTSEQTLLTFLVVGPGRASVRDYATLFRSGLRRLLENEGFAAIDIDRVVGQYQQVNLAPTNDRSVLGSLGQIAYLDGLARCDLRAIDHADEPSENGVTAGRDQTSARGRHGVCRRICEKRGHGKRLDQQNLKLESNHDRRESQTKSAKQP